MSKLLPKFITNFLFSELGDTTVSSPTTGQLPIYNEITGKWENADLDLEVVAGFEAFNSDGTQSTTSNGWVTKQSITSSVTYEPGRLKITHSAQIGQSDKQKVVGYQVQWRPVGGTWTTLVDVRNGLSSDDGYELRSGFNLVTLNTASEIEVRQRFGQTDEGGTGRSRFNAITIERVGS